MKRSQPAVAGFSSTMAEINPSGNNKDKNVKISSTDFEELSGIISDFERKLLNFLTDVRDEYVTDMDEINKINGLFRYNLYV